MRRVIVEYLSTTFALSDDETREELARFLSDPTDGIFRGPFLRVRTGFTPADDGWDDTLDWTPEGFHPHLHQAQAFARLSSYDHEPQPTIVTTGTGSGKIESFLVPILDHCACARARGQDGIKALLLYPMNALATDQARAPRPNWGATAQHDPDRAGEALARYLGLLSVARRAPATNGGEPRPLFSIQVHLWVREVSRLLRRVANEPSFRWNDSAEAEPDLTPVDVGADRDDRRHGETVVVPVGLPELPSVYCRHCGRAGWMATPSDVDGALRFGAKAYTESVDNRARTRTLIKATPDEPDVRHLEPAAQDFVDAPTATSVAVLVTPDETAARDSTCPSCGLAEGIRFLGSRVASLASVCITELFGSSHLELQERKLLAFTDSVQDAAHRAAFFAGRTYRFNVRTELATIIAAHDTAPGLGGGLTLADLGHALLDRAGHEPAKIYELTPPDLGAHHQVRTLWTDTPSAQGRALLAKRLSFETAEEFGFRHHVGRTLELTRTAAAAARLGDPDGIAALIAEARAHLTGTATLPGTVPGDEAYVRGLLERLRRCGAIFHPWLEPYVAEDGVVSVRSSRSNTRSQAMPSF